MNIKKLLIITSITLQFSTCIESSVPYSQDPTSWNNAFLAFGGGTNLTTAAASVQSGKGGSTARAVNGTLSKMGTITPEATVVAQYLDGQAMSSNDSTNLQAALAAAQGLAGGSTQLSDTINWTAAFAAFTGGASAVYNKTVAATMPTSLTSSSAAYKDAQVILQYLSVPGAGVYTGVQNATDITNLTAAFTANNLPASGLAGPQLSDTTNWTAAFAAFTGGASAVYNKTVAATMPTSLTSSSAAYKDAQVILQYLSVPGAGVYTGVQNATDITNLTAAFTANNLPASGLGSTALTARQTNGNALQQAIESAKATFNLLVPGTYTATPVIPAASLPA